MNANNAETSPGTKDPRTPVAEENTEIVNGEDQNQVINAQPAEEFVSNYLNNDSPGTTNADTNVENDADKPAADSDIDTEGNNFETVLPL